MNACAHYLHILYFLLGDTLETSGEPERAEGILCRANPIETFDTAMLRIRAAGAVLDFMATHTCREKSDPLVILEFEKGVAELADAGEKEGVRVTFRDGSVKNYGSVRQDFFAKIPYCCDVVRGKKAPVCTVETALPHLKTVDAVTELLPVATLSGNKNEKNVTVVPGLETVLHQAFRENKMPWEITDVYGTPEKVELKDYTWRDLL